MLRPWDKTAMVELRDGMARVDDEENDPGRD